MIVRVVTAKVSVRNAGTLHQLLRQQIPMLRTYDGLRYVKLARRLDGDGEEVILVEEWRDAASMYAWTGPDLERARLIAGASELLEAVSVTHYEALDMDLPDALSGGQRSPEASSSSPVDPGASLG
jgi:heme-degrading monooxygenase HmoA